MIRTGLRWFDDWVRRGDFRAVDLGLYRIVYAVLVMLSFPDFEWVTAYPDVLFVPPLGPMQLLGGIPPHAVVVALEALLALSLVALAFGLHTRLASFSVTLLMLFGFGLWNSFGKIDHNILVILVPAVMAFADWGRSCSLDALRGRATATDEPPPQWPLRFLGLLIGLSFITAARPKLYGGWLDTDTQAVRATLYSNYHVEGRQLWLADAAIQMPWTLVWEVLDWSTVALELGLLVALVSWRLFRLALAVAALFHVGVYLMMNIAFSNNVITYGAFVLWSCLVVPTLPQDLRDRLRRWAYPSVVGAAVVVWLLSMLGNLDAVVAPGVVLVGGAAALWYLLLQARALLAWRSGRRELQLQR